TRDRGRKASDAEVSGTAETQKAADPAAKERTSDSKQDGSDQGEVFSVDQFGDESRDESKKNPRKNAHVCLRWFREISVLASSVRPIGDNCKIEPVLSAISHVHGAVLREVSGQNQRVGDFFDDGAPRDIRDDDAGVVREF